MSGTAQIQNNNSVMILLVAALGGGLWYLTQNQTDDEERVTIYKDLNLPNIPPDLKAHNDGAHDQWMTFTGDMGDGLNTTFSGLNPYTHGGN